MSSKKSILLCHFLFTSFLIHAQCGSERMRVKTLKDSEVSEINFTPQESTVHKQRQFPKPVYHDNNLRQPSEKQVYVVECILLKFKRETNDNDYHLIVKDLNSNEKLVVEVPSSLCVDTTDPHLSGIPTIRALLKQELGTITTNYKNAKPGTRIRVTGVGFFDKKNHPTGFKGRELHPVLDLEFL
jgi:hypothetical protein